QAGRSPHHSIDFFFQSLAQDQHERAIGVVLSGTASDGTLGTEAIKAEGGITFAQDKSARYDSMPRSAIAAGCVDFVLSPETIAKELARIARHPYVAGQPLTPTPLAPLERERKKGKESADKGTGQNGFQKILFLLRNHSGIDFSLYKSNTVHRRIARRILLHKIDIPHAHRALLAGDVSEAVLDKARAGSYAKNFVNDLSPERLRRFFVEENGGYRVAKFLREMVIFARQNLLSDPPFSRMDLVTCRNLLIYLEQDLQRKILPTLHSAL